MTLFEDTATIIQPRPEMPCTVLLVDDDDILREQLAALISDAGYIVRTAASGEEALREFDREPARIVISDWEMPDMDGIALCRNVRARKSPGYTFVLLFTVRRNKRDVIAGLGAGADDYIVKGASAEEILARLNVGRRITGLEHSLRASNLENRKLAFTDALTGVYNRRFLMKHLPREFERCRRYEHALSVLVCDLDRFKLINDGYGHEIGDAVLRLFCQRASHELRSSDWVARTGGEEFVIVLPETDYAGAQVVAEKIRASMAAKKVQLGAHSFATTVSIGYSSVESQRDLNTFTFEELVRTADVKMYEAKSAGRNLVRGALAMRDPNAPEATRKQLTANIGKSVKLSLVDS
jgi:two-component system, cell cycle response regulator